MLSIQSILSFFVFNQIPIVPQKKLYSFAYILRP